MKEKIVTMLRESPEPMSGEEISRRLQVSRVAIWKQIGQLKESGTGIEAGPKGYRLLSLPEVPFPWLFGERSSRMHYYPELDSTMNRATALAREGCPSFTVVVADRQTTGRGRLQRLWQSEEGGLYFSVILRPSIVPREGPVVNFAVALALVETLAECCGITAQVKWPNDVLVDDCKIAGILSQMEVEADQIAFVNVGIGLNLNNRPEVVDKPAVSALQLTGRRVNRALLLADFLDRLERQMAVFSRSAIIADWKAKTVTLGRRVKIVTIRDCCEGLAVDMDEDGGLILEMADGSHHTVFYGDCFHSS